jgi:hypothetical protein
VGRQTGFGVGLGRWLFGTALKPWLGGYGEPYRRFESFPSPPFIDRFAIGAGEELACGRARDIIGREWAECLDAAVEVERLRLACRPELVGVVVLAESHVWTSPDEIRTCPKCHHEAVISAEPWPDDMPVPLFRARMECSKCGTMGADVRPNWWERER